MEKLIVIVGITGTQGYSVAQTFLSTPGWRVRGTTRNLSSPASQSLISQGVEMVLADLNSCPSLITAFHSASVIFGLTDFWGPFLSPSSQDIAEKTGQTTNEVAFDIEISHGIHIAEAAAQIPSLERFVYSSLADVKKWSQGKYTWVYHFDSKAKVVDYVRKYLPDLAKKMSCLQIGEYMTNWNKTVSLGQKKLPDGSFVLRKPHSGDAPIPMMWVERDAGKFVKALVDSPPGQTMLGFGSLIGWKDYIGTWGKMLGVGVKFEQIPPAEYLADLPENLEREIREGHLFHGEFGWDGGDPDVKHPKDFGVEGTPIEEYIRREDWSPMLEGKWKANA
ncbi:NAD(P)-binding protein [Lindgomyces ingoldianus]|uniref:NAD(P)-binding protein n=1 Tax=Lindgomyces ingoldianus TaxID=673940 RepID=A0ACB6QGI2_9PLEO|nr:NAD(P)-binding protein [Lindgomyces ingoldianus]KAF2466083.1 NAD(P)-binding protein [Lindgomyces ingoldianus]